MTSEPGSAAMVHGNPKLQRKIAKQRDRIGEIEVALILWRKVAEQNESRAQKAEARAERVEAERDEAREALKTDDGISPSELVQSFPAHAKRQVQRIIQANLDAGTLILTSDMHIAAAPPVPVVEEKAPTWNYWHEGDTEMVFEIPGRIVVSIEPDGIGYAIFRGDKFVSGKHDFSVGEKETFGKLAAEIDEASRAALPKEPTP